MERSEVNILSWNVKNKTSIADAAKHISSIADAAKHISSIATDLDIICVQELLYGRNDEADATRNLSRSLGMHVEVAPAHVVRFTGSIEALATLSVDADVEVLPPLQLSSGDISLWLSKKSSRRVYLQTSHLVPGWNDPLTVGTLHLSRPAPNWDHLQVNARQQKEEQDHLIDEIIPELVAQGGAVLTGDFNQKPTSKFIKAVEERMTNLMGEGSTKAPRVLGKTALETVDYVFVTEDVRGELEILDSGPSDHNPLLATVSRR